MKKALIATALVATFATSTVLAGSRSHSTHNNHQFRDTARVTHVEPIYRKVTTSRPTRECYQEEVYRPVSNGRDHNNVAGTIIGGVLGGALGHNIGGGHRGPAKVAGAVIGAAVGNQIARQNRHGGGQYRGYEERCETVNHRETSRRIDGYRVTYRYNGQTYTTRMDRDPGQRVRVKVSVTPVQ